MLVKRQVFLFAYRYGLVASFLLGCTAVSGAEITLAGVFGKKAVLIVDGGPPQTIAVGSATREGVKLLEVEGEAAVVRLDGQQKRLVLGSNVIATAAAAEAGGIQTQVLIADSRGHYVVQGAVNGAALQFMLDTGASMVSMGMTDARRAGIDMTKATPGVSQTANGQVKVWHVKLDSVRVGAITLNNVDGTVHESDLPFALLGMSFLGRVDLQHESGRLTMKKRF